MTSPEFTIVGFLEDGAVFSRLLYEGHRWFERFPVSIVAQYLFLENLLVE